MFLLLSVPSLHAKPILGLAALKPALVSGAIAAAPGILLGTALVGGGVGPGLKLGGKAGLDIGG